MRHTTKYVSKSIRLYRRATAKHAGGHCGAVARWRANSIALYFLCTAASALTNLRNQWRSGQLRDIVGSLFTFLLAEGTESTCPKTRVAGGRVRNILPVSE